MASEVNTNGRCYHNTIRSDGKCATAERECKQEVYTYIKHKETLIMAKRFFLTMMVLATIMGASTLSAKTFGSQSGVAYVNTLEIINSLPDKASATERLTALSDNYKQELQIMQNEYNKKYSDFITYQETLAESIKLRRMQELTDLENRIQNFTNLAQQDLEEHEQQLLEPIREKVKDAIKAVGIEQNFTVIYDLDDTGIVFVTPNAVDANQLVKSKLGTR